MQNPFFKNSGPFKIEKLLKLSGIKNKEKFTKDKIYDVKDLSSASPKDLTFFHSKKYSSVASSTKAGYCLTLKSLSKYLPISCKKIIVDNVLFSMANITKEFYPNSISDNFDATAKDISKTKFKKKIKYGKNVLLGDNVKIGKGCLIGHNTIIEKNVVIGSNCSIGSNVIINENTEIGCGSTIDRGSLSNTVIGKNTYLDNQVHIAHNNKIGNNCIIAGQVGFAGSSSLGDNVMIGGQAGISGHLKIGNNVHIGGGSGVIKNISDNEKVMGYPAKNLREFIKDNR